MEIDSFKHLAYDLKDLDETKGIVVAYANVYNNRDSDGDISAPGSFDKTVKENFKRIRVLKNHDPKLMIGVPLEIDTNDSYGLLTKSQFNMKKDLGRDMFTDVQLMYDNGLNAELSIGHKALKRDLKQKSIITEYYLGEYSFLSHWASNPLSTVQAIKSANNHYEVMSLLQKMYNLPYSDERLVKIELLLKSLSNEPDKASTQIDKPIITDAFKEFKQQLLTTK
jgi:HK97 family phage prohead protease